MNTLKEPIQLYSPKMEKLMLVIGKYMSENPNNWIRCTYISKRSSIYDFPLTDLEILEISSQLKVKIPKNGNLSKIADQIYAN